MEDINKKLLKNLEKMVAVNKNNLKYIKEIKEDDEKYLHTLNEDLYTYVDIDKKMQEQRISCLKLKLRTFTYFLENYK